MTDEQKAVERQNLIDILDRNFGYTDDEPAHVVADRLIAAGYRKQSETVKEFAEKVVEAMNEHAVQHGYDPEGLPYYTVDIAVLQIEIEQQAEQFGKEEDTI